jgi:manganese efflux pump family protein
LRQVSTLATILLALGLAADATAAAVMLGLGLSRVQFRHVLSVMLWFGLSQGGMALLGSLLGQAFGSYLAAWDHWLAFGLLAGLGTKMVWEALAHDPGEQAEPARVSFALATMFLLALATSIDALAVGVTLPLLDAHVTQACAVIGGVTALMSALGLWAGRRFGAQLGKRVDLLGGLLLIAIGLKILLEHLGVIG